MSTQVEKSIESEKIILTRALSRTDLESLPNRWNPLVQAVRSGASISELVSVLRASKGHSQVFLDIARFLSWLSDRGLLRSDRLNRFVNSIREEVRWPASPLSRLGWKSVIFSFKPHSNVQGGSRVQWISVLTFLASGLIFGGSHWALWRDALPLVQANFASGIAISFGLFVFASMLVELLRALFMRISQESFEVEFGFDLLGPYLRSTGFGYRDSFRQSADLLLQWSIGFAGVIWFQNIALLMRRSPFVEGTVNRTVATAVEIDQVPSQSESRAQALHWCAQFLFGLTLVAALWSFGRSTAPLWGQLLFLFGVALLIYPAFEFYSGWNQRRWLRWYQKSQQRPLVASAASDPETWAKLPVMRQLAPELRNHLLSQSKLRRVGEGDRVCRQGEKSRSLYIVLEGQLAVQKVMGSNRRAKTVALLSEGAVFGETAFFFGSPRTADVIATSDAELLEVPAVGNLASIDLSKSQEFQFRVWLLQALSANSQLAHLPSEALDRLLFAGRRVVYKAGEPVFSQGAPATACYFIAQGSAFVVQGGKTLRKLGAGDVFGEIALLSTDGLRTAAVVAESDLLCMELERSAFWTLLASHLPLGMELEKLAIRRLKRQ